MKIEIIKVDPTGVTLDSFTTECPLLVDEVPERSEYGLLEHRYGIQIGKHCYYINQDGSNIRYISAVKEK